MALFAPLTPYAYTAVSVLGTTEPNRVGNDGHLSPGSGTIRGLDKLIFLHTIVLSTLVASVPSRSRKWSRRPILAIQCSPVVDIWIRLSSRGINSGENSPSANDPPFPNHIMIYAHFPFLHRFRMNFCFSFSLVVLSYAFKVTNARLKFRGGLVQDLSNNLEKFHGRTWNPSRSLPSVSVVNVQQESGIHHCGNRVPGTGWSGCPGHN